MAVVSPQQPEQLGRYMLHAEIARGGMATVHVGRMTGAVGFSRTVAIKRLHPHLAQDPSFVGMFTDEARLASRIRHPNVVDTLDVVAEVGELFIVMDFVLGETFSRIIRGANTNKVRLPPAVVSAVIIGALEGLHAAHEAVSERGVPLGIVHRDISPQNILVGSDGVARVIDFGVAKAAGRVQETETGEVKGKLAYMSPEQLKRGELDRRCDIFAMSTVLWEALTGKRLFMGEDPASTIYAVLEEEIMPPSRAAADIPSAVDAVVLRGLERNPAARYQTAHEMAAALEAACPPASRAEVAQWVNRLAAEAIGSRADIVRRVEHSGSAPEFAAALTAGLNDPAAQGAGPVHQLPPGIPSSGGMPAHFAPAPSGNFGPLSGHYTPPSGNYPPHSSGQFAPPNPRSSSPTVPSQVSHVSHVTAPSQVTGLASATDTFHHPVEQSQPSNKKWFALLAVAAVLGGAFIFAVKGPYPNPIARMVVGQAPAAAAGAPPAAATGTATASPPPAADPALAIAPVVEHAAPPASGAPTPSAAPSAVAAKGGVFVPPPLAAPKGTKPGGKGIATSLESAGSGKVAPPPPPPPAAECENPFYIDGSGMKRPKPQCFGR